MRNPGFDQADYWRDRSDGASGIEVVGHRALGPEYNAFIYRRRAEALDQWLAARSADPARLRILDVGAGSGYYLEYWQRCGARSITAVEISPAASESLKKRFPQFEIRCADVTVPDSLATLSGPFDLITLFDVLYHITQDDAAGMALGVLSERLAREGRLLVFDHIMPHDYALRRHVRFRGKDTYTRLLAAAKLEIVERIPLFSVLEPPLFGAMPVDIVVSGAYRVAGTIWRAIPPLGRFSGSVAYRLDGWLLKRGLRFPNHELLVMRRI